MLLADTATGTDVIRSALVSLLFVAIVAPFVYYVGGVWSWGRSRWARWLYLGPLGIITVAAVIALTVGLVMAAFGWVVTTND